ncbi:MAG: hypothetical protein AB7G87_04975 [Clostridia bacterium]
MGRYNIPRPFKGETRYFYFLTKKALIYTSIGSGIGLLFLKLLMDAGHPITGIVVLAVFVIPSYIFGSISFPKDSEYNGGEDLDKVFFRKLKKMLNKYIYVTDGRREG